MPTYDPRSITLTIGGVPFRGFTSVEYRDAPAQSVVGIDGREKGRTKGRVVLMPPGSTPAMLDAARRIIDATDPPSAEVLRAGARAVLTWLIRRSRRPS